MKKYLMTGMAAIMFCGVFTSCSHDMDLGSAPQSEVIATYEEAFEARFGTPAANQDWGFGSSSRAFTRDGEIAIDPETHVGAYPNGNQWAAQGFSVPDPLTEGQKLRVQFYFQTVKNPGGTPDKGEIDFFMQQVYDGGTDAITKYDGYTSPTYSLEKYPAVNGQLIESGEHMDHLTAGPSHLHIYNYNNGNCGTYGTVLDNDGDLNNGPWHEDQIMLMLNTPTSCFGYANSDDSYVRDDRWTLVSGEVIDNYCDNINNDGWKAFLAAHEGVEDKQCYWDDWHRSYIGFDFDMLPDDLTYAWNWENGKKTTPQTVKYYWASPQGGNLIFTEDGQISEFTDWNAEIKVKGNKVIRVLNSDTNMYCGEVKGMGGMDGHNEWTESAAYDPNGTNDNSLYLTNLPGHQSDHKALNLKFLAKKYEEGWLPVDSKQLKLWVKVGGCNDGYYSDWIVSFLPAEPEDTPPSPSTVIERLRVIAEDLSVGENTDFDFNDVVFDVIWTKTYSDEAHTNLTSQTVEIKLLAAGGTLPLYVDGFEVHEKFGVDTKVMVNTRAGNKGLNGQDGIAPVTWTTTNYSGNTIGEIANSIEVKVTKNGTDYLLSAVEGRIASKIGIKPIKNQAEYEWCDEREDIDHRYSLVDGTSLFTEWVQGILPTDEWYTYAKRSIDEYRAAKAAAGNQQP
jgi:hypothetical protein